MQNRKKKHGKLFIWREKVIDYLTMRNRVYMNIVTVRDKAEIALNAIHDLLDEIATAESSVVNVCFPVR